MRHEKITLVVLGYVIGFVTAYIAFGSTTLTPTKLNEIVPAEAEEIKGESAPAIIFDEDGMFVRIGSNMVVISGRLRENMIAGPGFHTQIPRYEASPDGAYVYFCEQQTEAENFCHEYVYLVGKHMIKPLKKNGEVLTSELTDEGFEWTRVGKLTSDELESVSTSEPWKLETR